MVTNCFPVGHLHFAFEFIIITPECYGLFQKLFIGIIDQYVIIFKIIRYKSMPVANR